jgi:hypothetical protein
MKQINNEVYCFIFSDIDVTLNTRSTQVRRGLMTRQLVILKNWFVC